MIKIKKMKKRELQCDVCLNEDNDLRLNRYRGTETKGAANLKQK